MVRIIHGNVMTVNGYSRLNAPPSQVMELREETHQTALDRKIQWKIASCARCILCLPCEILSRVCIFNWGCYSLAVRTIKKCCDCPCEEEEFFQREDAVKKFCICLLCHNCYTGFQEFQGSTTLSHVFLKGLDRALPLRHPEDLYSRVFWDSWGWLCCEYLSLENAYLGREERDLLESRETFYRSL